MYELVALIHGDSGERLGFSPGPSNVYRFDRVGGAQSEVESFARLGEKRFSRPQGLDERLGAANHDLDTGADRVAIGCWSRALKTKREVVVIRWNIVAKKAKPRGIAVGNPNVKVTIMIPVGGHQRPSVVREIDSGSGRNVGKASVWFCGVEEDAVALPSAVRAAPAHHAAKGCVGSFQFAGLGLADFIEGMRQNLPPIETSQVARVFTGNVSVSDDDVLPTVVVEVGEACSPRPPCHGNSGGLTDIIKRAASGSLHQSASAGESLKSFTNFR